MRVLAVDDDPNDLRYVRDALSAAGYRPVVTGDPEEALRLMEEEQPQVVLLDLMLPDADGVDLMQAILEIADVPVHLVSLEYRLLAELAANAGRVLTYDHLLERVWGKRAGGDLRPMRAVVVRLRRRLGDTADRPAYVFNEPRVGYWVPAGEKPGEEPRVT